MSDELIESVSGDPVQYHTRMIKFHDNRRDYNDLLQNAIPDHDPGDLSPFSAHVHEKEYERHENASDLHQMALNAHKRKSPDAMKLSQKAFNASASKRFKIPTSKPPKMHQKFGEVYKFHRKDAPRTTSSNKLVEAAVDFLSRDTSTKQRLNEQSARRIVDIDLEDDELEY